MIAPTIRCLAQAILDGAARDGDAKALARRVLDALDRIEEGARLHHRIRGLEAELVQARARVAELEEVVRAA